MLALKFEYSNKTDIQTIKFSSKWKSWSSNHSKFGYFKNSLIFPFMTRITSNETKDQKVLVCKCTPTTKAMVKATDKMTNGWPTKIDAALSLLISEEVWKAHVSWWVLQGKGLLVKVKVQQLAWRMTPCECETWSHWKYAEKWSWWLFKRII